VCGCRALEHLPHVPAAVCVLAAYPQMLPPESRAQVAAAGGVVAVSSSLWVMVIWGGELNNPWRTPHTPYRITASLSPRLRPNGMMSLLPLGHVGSS
jgi:hypothetical protein